ncbi:hypothetical protein MGSAQ_001717, partial [marine sediment metagenome]
MPLEYDNAAIINSQLWPRFSAKMWFGKFSL